MQLSGSDKHKSAGSPISYNVAYNYLFIYLLLMSDKPQQVAGQRSKEKLSAEFVVFPPPLKPVQHVWRHQIAMKEERT